MFQKSKNVKLSVFFCHCIFIKNGIKTFKATSVLSCLSCAHRRENEIIISNNNLADKISMKWDQFDATHLLLVNARHLGFVSHLGYF